MAKVSIGDPEATLTFRDLISSRMQVVMRSVDQFSGRMERAGDTMQRAGISMLPVTAALGGLAAVAIKSGAEFERALNQVAAVSNASADDLKRLSDAATEWGQKTKFSNTEAAQAMLELSKAGFSVQETIDALPSTLELATAANLGLEEAASLTANTLKTFGLATTDLAHANDVLVAAANKSTIDVRDLREALKFVGPVAKLAGVSLADVASASAALGNAGIKAEMAGTALRGMFSQLLAPAKDTVSLLKELGFQQEVAAGQTVKWTDMLDRLKVKVDQGSASADKFGGMVLEAFGQRAGPAVIAMAQQGGEAIRNFSKELDSASEGSAKRMSEAFMKGVPGALETLKGALDTAATKLEQVLAPAIVKAAELGIKAAEIFTNQLAPAFMALPEPIQQITIAMLGLAAVTGPFLLFLGSASKLGGLAGQGLKAAGDGIAFLTRSLAGLGAAGAGFRIFMSGDWMIPSDKVAVWVVRFQAVADALGAVTGWLGRFGVAIARVATPLTAMLAAGAAFLVWLYQLLDVGPTVSRIFENLGHIAGDLAKAVGIGLTIAWKEVTSLFETVASVAGTVWAKLSDLGAAFYELARAATFVIPEFKGFRTVLDFIDIAVAALAFKVRQLVADLEFLLLIAGKVPKLPSPSGVGIANPFFAQGDVRLAKPVPTGDPFQQFLGTRRTPEALAATTKEAEALQKAMDDILGTEAMAEVKRAEQALATLGGQGKLTGLQLRKMADDMDAFQREGVKLPPTLDAVRDRMFFFDDMLRDTNALLSITPVRLADNTAAFKQFLQSDLNLIAHRKRFFEDMARKGPLPGPMLPSFEQQANVTQQLIKPDNTAWISALDGIAKSWTQMAQVAGDAMGSIGRGIGTAIVSFDVVVGGVKRFNDALKAMGQGAKASTAAAVTGILSIVGVLAQYGPSIAQGFSDLFGLGASDRAKELQKQIVGIGHAVDSTLSKLIKVRDALQAAARGITNEDMLQQLLGSVTNVQAQIDALEEAERKTLAAEAAMEKYGLSLEMLKSPADRAMKAIGDLADEIDALSGLGFSPDILAPKLADPLNDALRLALDTGAKLPASFEPFLLALIRGGGLADDLARKLLGLPPPDTVPWKEMEQAAERYGIKIDKLGDRFRNSKLLEGGEQLAADWELLVGNGADVNAVMDGMAGKANTFLQAAKKWGFEVPPSMRPMLQAMFDAGKLVDDNGDKLETLDDVNWGVDLKGAIDKLILAFQEMIDKILDIPKNVDVNVNERYNPDPDNPWRGGGDGGERGNNPPPYNPDNPNDPYGGRDPSVPLARGGIVTRPTRALIGERGPEAVIPLDMIRGRTGGGGTVTVIVQNSITAWDGDSVEEWLRKGGSARLAEHVAPALIAEFELQGLTRP